MWLFDCGLDIVEWRRTIVVYLSAIAPIILSLYLIYKNQMKKWISLTLLSSFLIAALGWEIWVNLICQQHTRFFKIPNRHNELIIFIFYIKFI